VSTAAFDTPALILFLLFHHYLTASAGFLSPSLWRTLHAARMPGRYVLVAVEGDCGRGVYRRFGTRFGTRYLVPYRGQFSIWALGIPYRVPSLVVYVPRTKV
jgi:hypothetical protein